MPVLAGERLGPALSKQPGGLLGLRQERLARVASKAVRHSIIIDRFWPPRLAPNQPHASYQNRGWQKFSQPALRKHAAHLPKLQAA